MKCSLLYLILIVGQTIGFQFTFSQAPDTSSGFIIEHESQLAKLGSGPHNGKGQATAYVFFKEAKDFALSFQKHVLHPGSEVGYHRQKRDEVYYIVSGYGTIRINEQSFPVNTGDAVLTRKDSYHGMKQEGDYDLVFIVSYPK